MANARQLNFRFCFLRRKKSGGVFLRAVRFFKTSGANVAVYFFAVVYVGNLLNVSLESSSRFTVGVADVVARRLTFPANIAYSGHIDTSDLR